MSTDLLGQVLAEDPPPFAILHRPGTTGDDSLEILVGDCATVQTLADIPVEATGIGHETLVIVPYRQIAERGFACVEDEAPLIAMTVHEQAAVPVAEVFRRIPEGTIELFGGRFDVSDADYADIVRKVIAEEIGEGQGANFVIKRSFVADITDYSPRVALTLFRRLLAKETGAYWTFVVHTGDRTFVGASPERHISLSGGVAVMNPISGTYRYPSSGPTLPQLLEFLADRKETDELYMVVDEELKMMAKVCDGGVQVVGPFLKEMATLAHTEYFIEGHSSMEPVDILRETLFAPTVTGSPLESACRVISRYEPEGRGYYSGVVALIGRDQHGERVLDSSILIRTADIDRAGGLRIGVGATLVRHSDPDSEVAETRAKAAGLLAALGANTPERFGDHPEIRQALAVRNDNIAEFWLRSDRAPVDASPELIGRRVLVVDAEDTFTSMIALQLRSLGLVATVCRFDEEYATDDYDLVLMGPGPGDPRQLADPKIARLRETIRGLLDSGRPFLAVCLSHQVLSTLLGFELVRKTEPNQGLQKEIDLFGKRERVGFYNTFAARSAHEKAGSVEVSRDPDTGEVHALRGPGFRSMQFHPESVLTEGGVRIVRDLLVELLSRAQQPVR